MAAVRIRQILGHAAELQQFQIKLAIPTHQLRRQRDRKQFLLLGRRQLLVDAQVELGPQPRHRKEQRRPDATQVFRKGFEAVGKEYAEAEIQRTRLDRRAFGNVCQRQVGQHPVRRRTVQQMAQPLGSTH